MDPLLWLALAALLAALLLAVPFVQRRFSPKKQKKDRPPVGGGGGAGGGVVMRGGARRNVRARIAAVQRARQAAAQEEEEGDGVDDEREEGLPVEEARALGKVGTKKLRKIQDKAERKAMREPGNETVEGKHISELANEAALREDRKRREALREEERKQEEEIERVRKQQEEEEQRKQREEQEKREHEEYLRLKESFVVEEEGEAGGEDAEESRGIADFINYIKKMKVVYLEDLAAEFEMKTQDAILRVQSLQEMGRLTGVVDDRGKFIYISQEELEAVAAFIKQRGRVSISELVRSSNTLINLLPETVTVQ